MRNITMSGRSARTVVVVEAELLEHARREVLDDDVARCDELLREREAVGMTEVERDAALAEVARVEQRRLLVELRVVVRPHRRAEPDAVGPLHGFDLDHVGAQRREPRGGERARPERGEVEDAQPGERSVTERVAARSSCPDARPTRRSAGPGATQLAVGARRGSGTARAAGSSPRPAGGRTRRARRDGRTAGARRRCRRSSPARARRRTRRRSRRRCARASTAAGCAFTSSARLTAPEHRRRARRRRPGRRGP